MEGTLREAAEAGFEGFNIFYRDQKHAQRIKRIEHKLCSRIFAPIHMQYILPVSLKYYENPPHQL